MAYRFRDSPRPPEGLPPECVPALQHPDARRYLLGRGLTPDEVVEYDLQFTEWGWYKRRIIIPMYDEQGELFAFQARSIDPDLPQTHKYLTCGPRLLYRPWQTFSGSALVLVEGVFDCFAVERVARSVAMLGIQPSPMQLSLLRQLLDGIQPDETVIWFDREALAEALTLQLKLAPHGPTRVVQYDGAKDPGTITDSQQIHTILFSHRGDHA